MGNFVPASFEVTNRYVAVKESVSPAVLLTIKKHFRFTILGRITTQFIEHCGKNVYYWFSKKSNSEEVFSISVNYIVLGNRELGDFLKERSGIDPAHVWNVKDLKDFFLKDELASTDDAMEILEKIEPYVSLVGYYTSTIGNSSIYVRDFKESSTIDIPVKLPGKSGVIQITYTAGDDYNVIESITSVLDKRDTDVVLHTVLGMPYFKKIKWYYRGIHPVTDVNIERITKNCLIQKGDDANA